MNHVTTIQGKDMENIISKDMGSRYRALEEVDSNMENQVSKESNITEPTPGVDNLEIAVNAVDKENKNISHQLIKEVGVISLNRKNKDQSKDRGLVVTPQLGLSPRPKTLAFSAQHTHNCMHRPTTPSLRGARNGLSHPGNSQKNNPLRGEEVRKLWSFLNLKVVLLEVVTCLYPLWGIFP